MGLQNDEQSKDLLDSQAHIWNHIFSFVNSMSLKCAIQLEILDIVNGHGKPMLLSELTEALSINQERSQFLYRLMRILVHSGFFVIQSLSSRLDGDEREGYSLAPASRILLKDEPLSIRPFLFFILDPKIMDPWQNMTKWFQNDDLNPFYTTHGSNGWEFVFQDQSFSHVFNEAMASDSRLVTNVVLKDSGSVFQGLKSIVDVGCGTGTVIQSIAKSFPDISCTGYDLPHVVNGLVGSNNLSYVGGDMFETIPKADVAFLKWIFHDWNDEDCVKLLKQCKEAIPSKENGGKLIIVDMVVKKNDEGSHDQLYENQLFFDMLMIIITKGKERTEEEWVKLFIDAGFSDYKITSILGSRSLIEVYP
ncbi:trans-resveratrol di-O-methyltransferase-like [Rutidosis leptorrhynchoides]|uniref:trans-resveratrol di-O-methyltransferase-like n=1 Tax=Rutidosis leptorrhynchoides TaxID=125765 RepID=UPI003A990E00